MCICFDASVYTDEQVSTYGLHPGLSLGCAPSVEFSRSECQHYALYNGTLHDHVQR